MVWLCLAIALASLAISLPTTALLVRLGHRLRTFDTAPIEGQVKMEARRVPNTGGIAIFLGIWLPMLAGLAVAWLPELPSGGLFDRLAPHVPGIREQTPSALVFLGCLALLHVTGLIDDRRPMGALPKFVIMLGAAGIAVLSSEQTRLLTMLDAHVGGPWLSMTVTIVWIVMVTNAMNFLDNMDGLTGGTTAVASACFLAATLVNGQWFVSAALACVLGASLGFLVFNFPPAKIFMGDGGSLVLGFTLGFLTVRTTYYDPAQGLPLAGGWYGVFMPLVVLAVPMYDFVSVTLIRLAQGKSPFKGDLQHFSHRLRRRGLSDRAVALVIYALTAATGLAGIILGSLEPWQALLVGAQTLLLLGVLAMFEYGARPKA